MQPMAPVKETVSQDTKASLRHLDSIDSAALKAPEVSSPHHPMSPAHMLPRGAHTGDEAASQGLKKEEEVKPLEGSSSGRGSGGSTSFNWASIKVHPTCLAEPKGYYVLCSHDWVACSSRQRCTGFTTQRVKDCTVSHCLI